MRSDHLDGILYVDRATRVWQPTEEEEQVIAGLMRLTHLALTDFRLYARLDMDFTRRVVLLVGGNAQGKSSLLEAIYYLTSFTSYQAENDRQLINFNAARERLAVARLVADYERGKPFPSP